MIDGSYENANRNFWDELADLHFSSKYYDVNLFKKNRCSLLSIEKEELGSICGKKLLHLQCHFGMDSLSLTQLGANVTAADFSERAISLAKRLSLEMNIDAKFILSSVEELPKNLEGKFDIIFTSYGVLTWLESLQKWAKTISHFLKKGGFFYIIDEHPFARTFSNPTIDGVNIGPTPTFPYASSGTPYQANYKHSYADSKSEIRHQNQYIWPHSMAEIINSLVMSGLEITFLHEFHKSFYPMFANMQQDKEGWWHLKQYAEVIPLVFSLKAYKK
ncbi:MAG: Methyltransferase type 12 [Chlamydiales bacterium]|jgi:2-polyprenyl-3-methyl-5-hydroxy-6-metoxy-1,4-benzoquinol methylase|nr:Methyltransferase type 12 [Chlamydiales bacterium]